MRGASLKLCGETRWIYVKKEGRTTPMCFA
jgi:hypothetical protein